MAPTTNRTTIYLEADLLASLRMKSAETSCSVSRLINDALRDRFAEDAEDLAVMEARRNEPTISFDAFVKELQRRGTI